MPRQKKLTERIEIRLSPQDKAVIEAHAREAGIQVTTWIRRRLMIDKPKETDR